MCRVDSVRRWVAKPTPTVPTTDTSKGQSPVVEGSIDADSFQLVRSKSKGKSIMVKDNVVSTRLLNTNNVKVNRRLNTLQTGVNREFGLFKILSGNLFQEFEESVKNIFQNSFESIRKQ